MIRSETGKFIFVHVQKTAGMSCETVLKEEFPDAEHWHGRHGHSATGIQEIGRDRWDEYYSFAFVRNPWDRMVSWYSMIQKNIKNLPFRKRFYREPFKSPFWNQVVRESNDFESFLRNCTEEVFDRGCMKSYAFNQVDYLTDEHGNLAVDFVGRFEDLAGDTAKVFDRLGISSRSLPSKNASKHKHYSHYYNHETRILIEERFQKDIEAFGYQFESL